MARRIEGEQGSMVISLLSQRHFVSGAAIAIETTSLVV